ncbi:MurR/RpiR family transcriptional regulator [Serpentinicella sp. ANB-PHB4]|uniref:MurR/RpiR family transcriptional regulator n=1 Tax=Serpentinicella sp. ANB-PHB4 TaxID=3074076 RepID=UPI00285DE708|nr:MurR/RpiR family transcriptional regulator [Serpentinicella sp. ANB-PHB4]MDR5658143.1 MurR/RpiR family transcriptional regulator [Serpentinicella sp. ANB-PHB4]
MSDDRKDLLVYIQKKIPSLSKSHRLIANYILEHYDKAAFLTASKLAINVHVSEATVVRFANALGFEGYPDLQKELRELVKTKLTTVQRVEMSPDYSTHSKTLKKVLKSDIENIRLTLENIDHETFQNIVNEILNAKKIYIVGLRSSSALAEYLGFYLNLILDNVVFVRYGISDMFEQIMRISEEDLLIGISYPRYANRTIELMNYAQEQGVKIIGLTDSTSSPIYNLADYALIAGSNMASFVDSLVAPLSLINALIVSVGMCEKEEITNYFNKLETIWDRYNVYNSKKR